VPDTTVVCTDSLWKDTIALPNSTIVDSLRALVPQKAVVKKLNSIETAAKL